MFSLKHLCRQFNVIASKRFLTNLSPIISQSNVIGCNLNIIYCTNKLHTSSFRVNLKSQKSEIVEKSENEKSFSELSLGQKVKQTSKDVGYTGIIIIGLGITGFMFYTVGSELFSSQSPNGMYTKALKMCKDDERVKDALGTPIKAYGEANSRGRRRYVRFNEYMESGVAVMNIEFHMEGPLDKARVFIEARQNNKKKYEILLIVVEMASYPHKTITVLDKKEILTTTVDV